MGFLLQKCRTLGSWLCTYEGLLLVMLLAFEAFSHPAEYFGGLLPAPQSGIALGGLIVVLAGGWVALSEKPVEFAIAPRPVKLFVALAWLPTARFLHFILPSGDVWLYWLIGIFALFALFWLTNCHPRWVISLSVLLGCAIRLYWFSIRPIYPDFGDMQPLVLMALDEFVGLKTPYRLYYMPWELPLTYLPLTWLAYLPAYWFDLDIRIVNLLIELAIGAMLGVVAYKHENRAKSQYLPRNYVLLWWGALFFLPMFSEYAQTATSQIFWLFVALTLTALAYAQDRLRDQILPAVLLGLGLATSPFVAVAALFIGLYWLRHVLWQKTAILTGIALFVAFFIVAPFAISAPKNFFFGVFQWFNDTTLYSHEVWKVGYLGTQPSLSVLFWNTGAQDWLKLLQIGWLAGLGAIYWRRGASLRALPAILTAAYLLFVAFNTVVWTYYYFVAFVTGLFALAYRPQPTRLSRRERRERSS